MNTRTIGGTLDMAALGQILGDRHGHERDHQPQHALALEHARDHLRRCLSALAAADVPDQQQAAEIVRVHSQLADLVAVLETLGRRL